MAENPLFYAKIVPLNRESHKDRRLDTSPTRFGFAATSHLVPAVTDEFTVGGRSLPIVFVPGPAQVSPVFLLGLKPGENMFVSDDGRWTAPYIPAYVRRYPFIIGEVPAADSMVCIDETAAMLHATGGEPLFVDAEQGPSTDAPILTTTIKFINDYLAAAKRTEAFVADLQALGLFRAITINIASPDGRTKTLHGVMSVDADKLRTLPDDAFLTLRAAGHLPLIYAHLVSLGVIETFSAHDIHPAAAPAAANGAKKARKREPEHAAHD